MGYSQAVKPILLVCLLILAQKSLENEQNTMTTDDISLINFSANDTNDTSWEKVEEYPKEKFEVIYVQILDELSLNDTSKKSILTMTSNETTDPIGPVQPCLVNAYSTFMKNCYFAYVVGGMRRFKQLFLQACKADWLDTEIISKALVRVCKNYRIGFLDRQ